MYGVRHSLQIQRSLQSDLQYPQACPLWGHPGDHCRDTPEITVCPVPMKKYLKTICEDAMNVGTNIDLSNCHYGETTGSNFFLKRPTNYYFFLAGLVRLQRLTQILEIGTNYGGSIMAISKGLYEEDIAKSRIVTVDITRKNEDGFNEYPHIKRIQGDSLSNEVAEKAVMSFDGEVDLIYIDSVHEYEHTRNNINIYAGELNPRYLVLDDIRQCDDMRRLWSELKEKFEGNAFDASDVSIRKGAGLGVIGWRAAPFLTFRRYPVL